jgi:hypothetical protein
MQLDRSRPNPMEPKEKSVGGHQKLTFN